MTADWLLFERLTQGYQGVPFSREGRIRVLTAVWESLERIKRHREEHSFYYSIELHGVVHKGFAAKDNQLEYNVLLRNACTLLLDSQLCRSRGPVAFFYRGVIVDPKSVREITHADENVVFVAKFPTYSPVPVGVSEGPLMQLYVKTLTGTTINLAVSEDGTVLDVQRYIEGDQKIPIDQQYLIFHGTRLVGSRRLSSYGISHASTLHLVMRLRGGMMHDTSGRSGVEGFESAYEVRLPPVPATAASGVEALDPADFERLVQAYVQCLDAEAEATGRKRKRSD